MITRFGKVCQWDIEVEGSCSGRKTRSSCETFDDVSRRTGISINGGSPPFSLFPAQSLARLAPAARGPPPRLPLVGLRLG
jgi:hypothetical protein